MPLADIVVDMHSGGRTALCPPWSEMHWVDDPEQRRQMVAGMLAWNTDVHFVYIDIAGTGLLVGEAERQGKIVVSTELGGGGHVTAATHRVAASGLANVLRHFGVLAGDVQTRETLGLGPATIVRATEDENYLLAPDSGLWETVVDLGDRVEPGSSSAGSISSTAPTASPRGCRPQTAATFAACESLEVASAAPLARSGSLHILGIASKNWAPTAPELPTIAEQGIAGFEAELWFGLLAPAGTPNEVVERYSVAINEIVREPRVIELAASQGVVTRGGTPEQLAEFLVRDISTWRRVVKEAGIGAE